MKRYCLLWLIAAAGPVSGCADPSSVALLRGDGVVVIKVSGAGQDVSVAHSGPFDLDVSGDGHSVRVAPGSTVRTLKVSGVDHGITVSAGASVQSIRLAGVGTTLHLPENLRPTVTGSGAGGRILYDVGGTTIPSQRQTTQEAP